MLNYKTILTIAVIILGLTTTQPVLAQTALFMEIPDIAGESQKTGRDGWIELLSFNYPVEQTQHGKKGRSRSRPEVGPVTITKKGDAASVYLNLATLQGRNFEEIVVEITTESRLRFRYVFTNVRFTSYSHETNEGREGSDEYLGMVFEEIRVQYFEINEDGSAGDEHEIEYDIVAGK